MPSYAYGGIHVSDPVNGIEITLKAGTAAETVVPLE
jgi:hypothetical protein